ncbi:Cutinase transcription factor 1 beta like protein [Verticillium longisporum]|uniref:Cutinase transcription factor 1 beta like protein n=1 Tax=Verticillium longisporum TaxID=100787 RepID=A0A8I3AIH9_VERLO|nr:Cutinase transcription factor 1 beta like protein [Verticillium longisporum]KAG7111227.1 Cutinase transcription factor 1 beta like protein [Verticillium longisporum]
MFVASASFVDDTLLTQDFYTSRTSLKCSVYQRAKVLYDLNYEQDKITLIQSVFLMGFWYTTSDDRQGPWHWNGIAITASHRYQFRIYFEATIIVLYRPFILEAPRDVTLEHEEPWRALACQKTRVAASNACSAVTSMMAEELIGLSHTITVIALVPPMHVHLFESASSKPLTSQMGKHNLALCMLAMSELRKSYISATAAYKLFEAAIKKIDGTRSSRRPSHQPQSDAVVVDLGAQEQAPLSPRESWPEGYSALSANVISDAWMWPNMLGSQNESWLDNQDLVGLYEPGDFTQALDGWT